MARLRSAPGAQPPAANATNATTMNARAALREKTNTTRTTRAKVAAKAAEKEANDFVKQVVKPRRGRGKTAAQNETTLTMAGGLGQRDPTAPPDGDGDTIYVAQGDVHMTTAELAKSDVPPPTAKAGRRPPRMTRKPVHTEAQSKVLDGLKKRMQAAANREVTGAKAAQVASETIETSSDPLPMKPSAKRKSAVSGVERSQFSISPSPPPSGKLSSVHRRASMAAPGSVLKVHGTPAVEASILALKNFKRRPRQGSMLAMVQQRTASARPSLAVGHRVEDASVFDLDDPSDEEDDFAPEGEGTPVQLSKAKKPASAKRTQTPAKPATPTTAANTRKRKSDGLDSSHSALDALRTKRHKSDAVPAEDDPMPMIDDYEPAAPLSSERQVTPQPQPTSDVQVLNSSPRPSSTPPTEPSSTEKRAAIDSHDFAVPSTEEQEKQAADEDDEGSRLADDFAPNATMAEPASSIAGSPVPGTQQTDVFADPLTQFSSPPPPRQAKTRSKAKAVSTATLQSLLPKRRQRAEPRARRTEYDISSDDEDENAQLDASHLEQDEDELGGRLRRRTLKATPVKSKKKQVKPRQPKAPLSARKTAKSTKTYGRKNKPTATSDKENELYESASEDEDESSVHATNVAASKATGEKSRELEAARRKFEEVDEWDMSFESMSAEDHRSSSQGWR